MKRFQLQTKEKSIKSKRLCISSYESNKLEKEFVGDIWKFLGKATVICIPTNNFITNGKNVMGGGLAKEALMRYPDLDQVVGSILLSYGFFPFVVKIDRCTHIMNFPTKPDFVIVNPDKSNIVSHARNRYNVGDKAPGFHSIGCLDTIRQSAKTFVAVLETMKERWTKVIIPKLGTGLGELPWSKVKKVLMEENLYQQPNVHFISKE